MTENKNTPDIRLRKIDVKGLRGPWGSNIPSEWLNLPDFFPEVKFGASWMEGPPSALHGFILLAEERMNTIRGEEIWKEHEYIAHNCFRDSNWRRIWEAHEKRVRVALRTLFEEVKRMIDEWPSGVEGRPIELYWALVEERDKRRDRALEERVKRGGRGVEYFKKMERDRKARGLERAWW